MRAFIVVFYKNLIHPSIKHSFNQIHKYVPEREQRKVFFNKKKLDFRETRRKSQFSFLLWFMFAWYSPVQGFVNKSFIGLGTIKRIRISRICRHTVTLENIFYIIKLFLLAEKKKSTGNIFCFSSSFNFTTKKIYKEKFP